MKKKEYMIPTCEVVEMEVETMVLAGSIEITPGEDDEIVTGGNKHRGEWGNLWNR